MRGEPKRSYYAGDGEYEAVYNATKVGYYSLKVEDASDGAQAVGSPFQVLVEPNKAFAPATLVWWDKQVGVPFLGGRLGGWVGGSVVFV